MKKFISDIYHWSTSIENIDNIFHSSKTIKIKYKKFFLDKLKSSYGVIHPSTLKINISCTKNLLVEDYEMEIIFKSFGRLFVFYGISTLVGYFMQNPVYIYIYIYIYIHTHIKFIWFVKKIFFR